MSEPKKPLVVEFKTSGILTENGVKISEKSSIDALSNRGYGTVENGVFTLAFYESLYLMDKGMLDVKDDKDESADFQRILRAYEEKNVDAWVNYLVYRDLRVRGYVVREGFGEQTSFRIYERGAYGKDTAPYLVLGIQEGKPMCVDELAAVMQQCQSQKKELIIAVMNRRGEIVHYSVSQLNFQQAEK